MNQNKPIVLAIEEGEQILVSAINQILSIGVSPYFAEILVEKVHNELKDLAKKEVEQAKTNYASALQSEKNKGEATLAEQN